MMQVSTASRATSAFAFAEKARRHKDGSVLLSIDNDRICKLNGVGALTWMILEENPAGLTLDELVCELDEQFAAINAERLVRYDVSREQLRADTSRFLLKMVEMNLLRTGTNSRGEESYCIREGVNGTTASTVAADAAANDPTRFTNGHESADSDIQILRRETVIAFIGLLTFDLLLKFRGFASVISTVEGWPIADSRTPDLEACRRVRAMVDRAQMYYPKKAMCLQHSAVVTCLLRRRGVPATMVLAAQEFPPKAHAWAEVNGEVVNDHRRVKTKYLVLRQI